jgi:hypothetical protein
MCFIKTKETVNKRKLNKTRTASQLWQTSSNRRGGVHRPSATSNWSLPWPRHRSPLAAATATPRTQAVVEPLMATKVVVVRLPNRVWLRDAVNRGFQFGPCRLHQLILAHTSRATLHCIWSRSRGGGGGPRTATCAATVAGLEASLNGDITLQRYKFYGFKLSQKHFKIITSVHLPSYYAQYKRAITLTNSVHLVTLTHDWLCSD